MSAHSPSLFAFSAELTQLQIVIARRWRLRCYARLRRRVMSRWAVGRRKIFYKMWGEWRHSIRTIQAHRRCANEIALEVRAAQYFSHSYYAWAFDTWTAWLASWLEYQRKLRQAYALWRKIEVSTAVRWQFLIVMEQQSTHMLLSPTPISDLCPLIPSQQHAVGQTDQVLERKVRRTGVAAAETGGRLFAVHAPHPLELAARTTLGTQG